MNAKHLSGWLASGLLAVALALPAPAPVAAETLPAMDFARHPSLSSPRLSPDGVHLAVRMDDEDGSSHALVVYKVADMSIVSVLRMPIYRLPLNPTWVSNEWLVFEVGREYGSLEAPTHTGEVFATRLDGKQQNYLFGHDPKGRRADNRQSDQAFGYVVGHPLQPNGHVYVRAEPWGREDLSLVYDIDAENNTRRTLARMKKAGMRFLIDPAGEPAFAWGHDSDFTYSAWQYRVKNWTQLDEDTTGAYFAPFAFTEDGKELWALWSHDGGPETLIRRKRDGSDRVVLAQDVFADIGSIQWSAPPRQPFAVLPAAGKPEPVFVNAALPEAALYKALQQSFPNQVVEFIYFTRDGKKLLFATWSDRDQGSYFLIDTQTHAVQKLFDVAPWSKPAALGSRESFRFKAGDGMELEAIVTFPPERAREKLPAVLLPHGGPHGVSDDVAYDGDAQFLANRGYLVVQVNFRGSGSRGRNFGQAGYLNWGTRIQQDLIDGMRWAVKEGFADPERICSYGGSFGAYSALMVTIRDPELFRCAVGYAGIYDLAMMYKKGDIKTSKSGRSYLTTVIGRDDADLAANSPAQLADQVPVPVLLVHGKADERAPYAQARAMEDALKAARKPVETLFVAKEGHGFYEQDNRVAFLERLEAFLRAHIGAGAAPADEAG